MGDYILGKNEFIDIICNRLCDENLESDDSIEKAINRIMKNLLQYDKLLKTISDEIKSIRKKRIQLWESIVAEYVENKESYDKEIKKRWLQRRINLNLI